MRKIILATLLGLGAIAGFTHGAWSVRHYHGHVSCDRGGCERAAARGCPHDRDEAARPAAPDATP